MKTLLILLMLSPLSVFADKLYKGFFTIEYSKGNESNSYYSGAYDTTLGLSKECKKSGKLEALEYSFKIVNAAFFIKSIKVQCVDEDFNIVNIDLTKEILDKVKK
jgi:hypothetical protein